MSSKYTEAQRETIKQSRAESILDPRIPLGMPPVARVEHGEKVAVYYARKHGPAGAGPGRFYGLHQVYIPPWEQRR